MLVREGQRRVALPSQYKESALSWSVYCVWTRIFFHSVYPLIHADIYTTCPYRNHHCRGPSEYSYMEDHRPMSYKHQRQPVILYLDKPDLFNLSQQFQELYQWHRVVQRGLETWVGR